MMMSRLKYMSTLQWIYIAAGAMLLSTTTPCFAQFKVLPEPSAAQPQATPDWRIVTKNAGWQPRDSQGELGHKGRLWIFGGWSNNPSANWGDVWYSRDGRTWHEVNMEGTARIFGIRLSGPNLDRRRTRPTALQRSLDITTSGKTGTECRSRSKSGICGTTVVPAAWRPGVQTLTANL